jgi:AAA+ superfamily predicted ATPase
MDETFARRFQSMVQFRMPTFEQRQRLWEDNFKDKPYRLSDDVNFAKLAQDYELSGGAINNILRSACPRAIERAPPEISIEDLITGIRRELHKESKFVD